MARKSQHPQNTDITTGNNNFSYVGPKVFFFEKKRLLSLLDFAQKTIVILGIPISVCSYISANEKAKKDQEALIYDKMDDRYWRYEELAIKYPRLGISDASFDTSLLDSVKKDDQLTGTEPITKREMMNLLISIYERAFIMYEDQDTEFKKEQWSGWKHTLTGWLKRDAFREAWKIGGCDYDRKFKDYVNNILKDSCDAYYVAKCTVPNNVSIADKK